ncbi:VOC family protein [Azospirillum sp. sgz302134]
MLPDLHLCHVFVFVEPGAPEAAALDAAGLRPSYRRQHPGQGTANLCYCFDNAFLELLWETDADAIRGPSIARTRLAERARWRETGACPFGISVRTDSAGQPLPFETWDFAPPYLPPGMTIPVSLDSEDPARLFLFRSPGSTRPDAWTDGRAGDRQSAAGLAEIVGVHLSMPLDGPPGGDLAVLSAAGILTVEALPKGAPPRLELSLSRADGGPLRRLSLPDFRWLD